ncbi:MAG: Type 1 glutamine amidotransferase-like domain-containing protein [Eubacteriales bacterium]|nr:Type 1 glutamine amidotransferase-like domain-containing protein [Eubacteriales bacterium]
MTLFITSSPYVCDADRPILSPANGFVEDLAAHLPPYPRALFVASDPFDRDNTCRWGADTAMAFAEAGLAFRSYHVLDGYNGHEAALLVENSDLIVLAGGHVPTQNAFFRDIGLAELMADYGGVVMGISAGSMNLARDVYVQPEEPGESLPDFVRFQPGLGLTDVNILPHYQKVKDNILDGKRLFEDVVYPDSLGRSFYALTDGSYIRQENGVQILCGEARRLKNGILELLTLEGEQLDLAILR